MYTQFFGLRQEPFSIAPDPRYLFMSERHREALAHLLYGLGGGGGFVLLTGEIGAGKTTVCRCFLEQIPKRCNVAYIFNPKLTVVELLKSICDEFRIPAEHQGPGAATVKDYVDPLNAFLLKTHAVGQNNVLIIDEAQNLSADVLEQLRLLTNLETSERKLLQIILIGQPELRTMLARPELEQLAQRVVARFHLDALSESETVQYIRHRLAVAGRSGPNPFDRESVQRIHQLARGVPRRINLLADRALLGAYSDGKARVRREIVDKAAGEVFDAEADGAAARRLRRNRIALVGLGVVAGAAAFAVVTRAMDGGAPSSRLQPVAAAASAAAAPASQAVPAGGSASGAPAARSPGSAESSAGTATRAGAATTPVMLAAADLKGAFKAALQRDERQPWRELAATWKLAPPDGDADPCAAAQRQQVLCYRGSGGTVALLRQLDRPVVLTLHDDAGNAAVDALLVALSPQGATLRAGGVTQSVSLGSLARLWRGEFAALWRAPPGYLAGKGGDGAGAAADWLADRLATANGEPAPAADKPPGDTALRSKVQAFQVAQGLKADGVAGPVTLMQLNRATGVDEPRLQNDR